MLQFSAGRLSAEAASRLQLQLTSLLRGAALPVELLSAAVDTVAMVTLEAGDEEGYPARLDQWCAPLIEVSGGDEEGYPARLYQWCAPLIEVSGGGGGIPGPARSLVCATY